MMMMMDSVSMVIVVPFMNKVILMSILKALRMLEIK